MAEHASQAARSKRNERHEGVNDGWWHEAYTGSNGWLIEADPSAREADVDAAEAEALYRLIEQEVAPSFYDRDGTGVPRRWMKVVKEAMRTVAPRFGARRMVKQYADEFYAPMAARSIKNGVSTSLGG